MVDEVSVHVLYQKQGSEEEETKAVLAFTERYSLKCSTQKLVEAEADIRAKMVRIYPHKEKGMINSIDTIVDKTNGNKFVIGGSSTPHLAFPFNGMRYVVHKYPKGYKTKK